MKDYFYILGIEQNASIEQIKSAYRKLSIKFHPDKNSGDKFFEDRFKEILEAYETLGSDDKRRVYLLEYSLWCKNNKSEDFKKYESELRKQFEEELIKREAEIKRRYQTPAQRAAEEEEIRRKKEEAKREDARVAEENRIKKAKQEIQSEIDRNTKLYHSINAEKIDYENRVKKLNQKKLEVERLINQLTSHLESLNNFKNSANTGYSFQVGEVEIIKEVINKINLNFDKEERRICLHLLMDYAKNSSFQSEYKSSNPKIVDLILSNKIPHVIFYNIYYRLRLNTSQIRGFEEEVIRLFNELNK